MGRWHVMEGAYLPVATPQEACEPADGRNEHQGATNARLRAVDRIPCVVCGLRGHVAGDEDRCLQVISSGLGQEQW